MVQYIMHDAYVTFGMPSAIGDGSDEEIQLTGLLFHQISHL